MTKVIPGTCSGEEVAPVAYAYEPARSHLESELEESLESEFEHSPADLIMQIQIKGIGWVTAAGVLVVSVAPCPLYRSRCAAKTYQPSTQRLRSTGVSL